MAVVLGAVNNNKLGPHGWTAGTGSMAVGGYPTFNANGDANEQNRYTGTDPWGNSAMVWQCTSTGGNDASGGWNTDGFAIDNTKLYRFSVWVRRTSATTGGTFYFGLQSSNGNAINISSGGTDGNPYWYIVGTGGLTQNQWYLVVGHCYPVSHNGTQMHPDSGIYTTASGKIGNNTSGADFKWSSGTTTGVHRTYHYYCTDTTTRIEFFWPRVDIVNGSQPSISQLLTSSTSSTTPGTITFSDGTVQTYSPAGAATNVVTNSSLNADAGSLIDVQAFRNSGTWTNPGAAMVHVKLIGGGGGGAGYCESGGAGCYAEGVYNVSTVGSVAVTVGGGGSYAAYYAAASQGGTTSFGSYLSAIGGYGANQQYGHSGGHGGNSASGAGFWTSGGGGCGHINSVGHAPAGVLGGSGYFGGPACHARNHSNLGGANDAAHTVGQGAPGSGGSGNITDWGNSWTARGHSAGGYGSPGIVIVYSYK